MHKKSYVVTDAGGPRPDVAGKLRMPGDHVSLTDREAEYELRRGTIEESAVYDARQRAVMTKVDAPSQD